MSTRWTPDDAGFLCCVELELIGCINTATWSMHTDIWHCTCTVSFCPMTDDMNLRNIAVQMWIRFVRLGNMGLQTTVTQLCVRRPSAGSLRFKSIPLASRTTIVCSINVKKLQFIQMLTATCSEYLSNTPKTAIIIKGDNYYPSPHRLNVNALLSNVDVNICINCSLYICIWVFYFSVR